MVRVQNFIEVLYTHLDIMKILDCEHDLLQQVACLGISERLSSLVQLHKRLRDGTDGGKVE